MQIFRGCNCPRCLSSSRWQIKIHQGRQVIGVVVIIKTTIRTYSWKLGKRPHLRTTPVQQLVDGMVGSLTHGSWFFKHIHDWVHDVQLGEEREENQMKYIDFKVEKLTAEDNGAGSTHHAKERRVDRANGRQT